jgi:hypothetical protein
MKDEYLLTIVVLEEWLLINLRKNHNEEVDA